MKSPLVSIIIPCFNYARFLPFTLDNVLSQSYTNWECILINDGSTDDTELVVKPYLSDPRFVYIYQQNGGLANARNTGLKIVRGDYIQFLDADDLMEEDKIAIHLDRLESNAEIDITYGDVHLFLSGDNHKTQSNKMNLGALPQQGKGAHVLDALLVDNFFLVHCPLLRRSVYERIGYFNETMNTCEDWDYWFRCAYFDMSFHYSSAKNEIVYVRGHGSNMSSNKKNMWSGKIKFYTNALALCQQKVRYLREEELLSIRIKALTFLCLISMRYNLFFGNVFSGLTYLFKYIYYSKEIVGPLYDAMYWVKERVLNRNR